MLSLTSLELHPAAESKWGWLGECRHSWDHGTVPPPLPSPPPASLGGLYFHYLEIINHFLLLVFSFQCWGIEPRALCILDKAYITELYPQPSSNSWSSRGDLNSHVLERCDLSDSSFVSDQRPGRSN